MIKLIKVSVVILVCISLAASSVCMASETECRSWYIKRNGTKPPTPPPDYNLLKEYGAYYIDDSLQENEKRIYLTFDAGYENGNIERILDTLDKEGIKAAFFVLDNLIIKNTELVKRMAENGHLVCNHTKNHKNLTKFGREDIIADLSSLENVYREYTGYELAKYFRFPEGKYSEASLQCVSEMGYKTVFWSFAYADWDNCRQPKRDFAIKKVLDNTHNGAIFLFHPTSKTNADIMPYLVSEWKNMGYEFGTLDELTKNESRA